MSDIQRSTLWRSIGAIFAGLALNFILSTLVDVVLHATGVFPPWGQPMADSRFVLATTYRIVFSILGCYLTARLAPRRPMAHAMSLGVFGVILCVAAAIGTWNKGPEFGPHWYSLGLAAVALPCAWTGGKLFELSARAHPERSAAT